MSHRISDRLVIENDRGVKDLTRVFGLNTGMKEVQFTEMEETVGGAGWGGELKNIYIFFTLLHKFVIKAEPLCWSVR